MKKRIVVVMLIVVITNIFADLNQGLVAYYPFNGNANDESGNGNDCRINGATLTFDRNGISNSAYSFDGYNDYIEKKSLSFNENNVFTVSFWVKLQTLNTVQYLIDFRYRSQRNRAATIIINKNYGNYTVYGDGKWKSGYTKFQKNKWYHFTAIHNSKENWVKTYIDGKLDINTNINTDFSVSSSPIRIGARGENGSSPVKGILDDIRIYNRALSLNDIIALSKGSNSEIFASSNMSNQAKNTQSNEYKNIESNYTKKETDIDRIITSSKMYNPNAIAVVIGNKDYSLTKKVKFAVNDAKSIKKYLTKTLGFKEGNIFYIENASKSQFELYFGNERNHKGKLYNAVKPGKSDIFVFYSGHGAPGLKDKKGYFVPVECDPQYIEMMGYSAEVFYKNISKINARNTTILLDACFSGAELFENISPMTIEIDNPVKLQKNSIILSSSSGSQVSSWYNKKEHGMFTYFFLKAIHNKNADFNKDNKLSYDELYKYISDNSEGIPYYARRLHGLEQTPTIEGKYKNKTFIKYK